MDNHLYINKTVWYIKVNNNNNSDNNNNNNNNDDKSAQVSIEII